MQRLFTLGDRVQATDERLHLLTGRCGAIVRVYPRAPGLYLVQLDGEDSARIFAADGLALTPRPPERATTPLE